MDRNVSNVSLGIEPYPSERERERGVGRCFEGPDASMSGIGEMTQPAFYEGAAGMRFGNDALDRGWCRAVVEGHEADGAG